VRVRGSGNAGAVAILNECNRLITTVTGTPVGFWAIFDAGLVKAMFGRFLVTVLVIVACLVGLAAPVLVDARHWWPRKPKR
jgi:hypothetical protein